VVVLHDGDDQPVTGVIVEVQRQIERDTLLTWPAYVATLRAKLTCAAVLLVIAPDPGVAAWARQPIELGHPGFRLMPIVIGFEDVPWVRDRAAASHLPELAVLSVMAHPELEIAEVAIDAIAQLPTDQARLYSDVILMALPAAIRQILEARMQHYEYQSDFARKYYGQGRKEGRQEGHKKGRQKGRKEGRQEGLRAAVVSAVAAAALVALQLGVLAQPCVFYGKGPRSNGASGYGRRSNLRADAAKQWQRSEHRRYRKLPCGCGWDPISESGRGFWVAWSNLSPCKSAIEAHGSR